MAALSRWTCPETAHGHPADIPACGTGPPSAHQRTRPLEETEWLYITAPVEGVLISVGDVLLLGEDVQRFEDTHDLFGRIAVGGGLSEECDYDWPGMNAEITRRVFEEGLLPSQSAWIRELQDWFDARSEDGASQMRTSSVGGLNPFLRL
ncbi:hypothetical protein [Tabrizicola sp.]|uniref:hypothetical protein n=1 Tax=Tabrizicola sp. TaxID=2005166 RepID=UPI00273346BF|nr:hypothetical protein [Tabrizicola sp.]MDP3197180.1 hypothetical protein [Tabrizicola sp.]MDZ4067911.1 hypothetical protein [Tabrizicola sp.]